MKPHMKIADAITRSFGLMSRSNWAEEIDAAVRELGHARGRTPAQAVEDALNHGAILREIASRLTIVETHFMRHPAHFELLVSFMAERLGAPAGAEAPRVLSAGCGTGEEPYSMVIALREALGRGADRVEVLATDLDGHAIAAARAACYRPWAFRGTSRAFRDRYFEQRGEDSRYQLIPDIRHKVSFQAEPILSYLAACSPQSVDAIFFRNVSIYLELKSFDAVVAGFHRILRPGGLLVTSPADRCAAGPLFCRHHDAGLSAYFRVSEGELAGLGPSARPPRLAPAPVRAARSLTRALPSKARGPRRAPSEAPARAPASSEVPMATALQEISALADRARFDEALALADALVTRAPAEAAPFLTRGQLHFGRGETELALADLRRAVFLDGAIDHARLWFAMALQDSGRPDRARRQLRELERRLAGPADEGSERAELRQAVSAMLED